MVSSLHLHYVQIASLPQVCHSAFARFIKQMGSLQALSRAHDWQFQQAGIDDQGRDEILRCLGVQPEPDSPDFKPLQQWLEAADDRRLICFEDQEYPTLLKQTACPPPLLYLRGDPAALDQPQLAIVGSRKASRQGSQIARWLASELAKLGFCITSGLASGIDTAAHHGALSAQGCTLAVLGSGLNKIYPSRNLNLATQINDSGALVSEFPLQTPPLPGNFPQRNRIIAGLSLGVVVVEAAPRSGSLITARLAMEANREVFAVPGSILSGTARGCHRLIRDGAKLADSVDAILEELVLPAAIVRPEVESVSRDKPSSEVCGEAADKRPSQEPLGPEESRLIKLLDHDPRSADTLASWAGMPISEVNRLLVSLELRGLLTRHGGRFQRLAQEVKNS